MDSLNLLEEWLNSQESFEQPGIDLDAGRLDYDAGALGQESCLPLDPYFDSALDACLDDYLPADSNFNNDWLLGDLDNFQAGGIDQIFEGQSAPMGEDAVPIPPPPIMHSTFPANESVVRMDKLEAELQSMRDSIFALRQELDNYNDWSYKLTFIVNEIQMRQHGLPPTLRQRGKLLPMPNRPGDRRLS
ncbi:hypothetical protein M409DRAFT_61647 [Zasmidium cellare ATCC 36951]|uniref:Uncharacterized protein n=1 Tax=Zasmidium cellare ATCC 36951 TaxID=1080233 RepID=A0A6A6BUG6_ZASCE|nr:uncharacterized protein M409DRAFT_61647 [Zasmidium cellare ATCC 36951]KAF2158444.1 hypothetical protein M409DRAFT_61647 [Zasmidium cellare ATCC 36951]